MADGLVFLDFEWVVKHGTDWLCNDVVDSDDVRWRVVPLALALSVALSALMRALGQARWPAPHMDPLVPPRVPAASPRRRRL